MKQEEASGSLIRPDLVGPFASTTGRREAALAWIARVAFFLFLVAVVAFAGRGTALSQVLAGVAIGIVVLHAYAALGAVEASIFVALTFLVSFTIENVGVATGVPFGHYLFRVGAGLPHVGRIPFIVGGLYVGMGWAAWVIAGLVVAGRVGRPRDAIELLAIPAAAAFVMVQWDAVLDPAESTLARNWVWFGHGGYFGVPLTNFLGWYLTTWLYLQLFAGVLFLRRAMPAHRERAAAFWCVPVLLYLAAGLCHVPPLLDADATLVDGAGRIWSATDLRETVVAVMLVTMLPSALLALLALLRRHKDQAAAARSSAP